MHEGPDILGGVTAGLIIILIAILFVITPNLLGNLLIFITDFAWQEVYPGFIWWAPQNPHPAVYNTLFIFFLGTLAINIIVLILRVIFRDSYRRQIESIGGIIVSAGVSWAAYNLILNNNFTAFAGWTIVFIGISIIISSLGQWTVRTLEKE
jgi:hypothetical protein